MRHFFLAAAALAAVAAPLAAQSADRGAADRGAVDRGAVNRIIDEGANHSQVMQTAQYLSDMIGARLTNSPAMRKAEDWTQSRFRDWGLNVHKEGFEFGRGRSEEHTSELQSLMRISYGVFCLNKKKH